MRFVIFSEDQHPDAPQVVTAFVKRLLQYVAPTVQTGSSDGTQRPSFVPDIHHKAVMSGNNWREAKLRSRRTEIIQLVQAIADYLSTPDTFVIFHTDGDTKWSERHTSEIRGHFELRIVDRVKELLRNSRLSEAEQNLAQARLLHVVPHYSIEAWLYQNIDRCRHHAPSHEHGLLDTWHDNPQLLDEVLKPKEALSIGNRHCHDLATNNFPKQRLLDAAASFVACGEQFKANQQLVEQLDLLTPSYVVQH